MSKFKIGDKVKLNPNKNHDHYVRGAQKRIENEETYFIVSMAGKMYTETSPHSPPWIFIDAGDAGDGQGNGFYSYEKYLMKAK